MPAKLVLIVRTDLRMGKGKVAAQVAHAAVAAALRNQGTARFAAWLREGQPKVVLKVDGADELRRQSQADRDRKARRRHRQREGVRQRG